MRMAAFSNWRVQPFEPLIAWLRKVHPDISFYGGDDTVRLGEISESVLHKIAQDFEGGEETITPSNQDNIIIESNTTLSKFKQKHEHLEKGSLFNQLAALGIVKMKPRTNAAGEMVVVCPRCHAAFVVKDREVEIAHLSRFIYSINL